MMMKFIVLFVVLATTIVVSAQSDNPYRVELLDPRGFRILRPGTPLLNAVQFATGSINGPTKGRDNEIARSSFSQRDDGWWVYKNTNATLNPGDILFYNIEETSGWCGVILIKEFHVPLDAPRVPT